MCSRTERTKEFLLMLTFSIHELPPLCAQKSIFDEITSLEVKHYSTTLLWSEKIHLLLNPSGAGAQDFKESFPTSPVKSTSNHRTKTLYWTHDGGQQVDWHVVCLWKPKLFFFSGFVPKMCHIFSITTTKCCY